MNDQPQGRSPLRTALTDVDLFAGVSISVLVAILGVAGVIAWEVVAGAILAILALLLTLFSRLRSALKQIEQHNELQAELLASVRDRLTGPQHVSQLLRFEYPDLSPSIAEATEVFVVAAGSLRTTVGMYFHAFESAAKSGVRLRFICPDPQDRKLMSLVESLGFGTPADVRDNLRNAQTVCLGSSGPCEVRVVRELPTLGMVFFKGNATNVSAESVLIKLVPYRYARGFSPVVELDARGDREFFDVMLASATALWEVGVGGG